MNLAIQGENLIESDKRSFSLTARHQAACGGRHAAGIRDFILIQIKIVGRETNHDTQMYRVRS